MMTDAQFDLITLPTSGTTAILERNSLQHWFEKDAADAGRAVESWKGMQVRKPQMAKPTNPQQSRAITFEATYACNLRCKYCFMADDPEYCANHRHMEIGTATRYLRRHADAGSVKHIRAGFLGGEPTLNMDLLCRVADYCAKTYEKASFNLTTNGTMLTQPLRSAVSFELNPALGDITIGEWLARRKFGMTLSMDGPKVAHDLMRVHGDGRGSFNETMDALMFLKVSASDWVKRFTFRATYGDDLSCSIVERLRFFNGLISDGIGGSVHMEPSALKPETLPVLRQQHEEATEWFIAEVKAGRVPKWADMTKLLTKLVRKTPSVKNCGAGANYLTCGVDGQIYACHRTLGALIGDVNTGVDTEKAAAWEDNRVYSLEDCANCEAKYVCGGGCRAANYAEHGTTTIPAATNCFVKRLRLACALRIIEALAAEELDKMCSKGHNMNHGKQTEVAK